MSGSAIASLWSRAPLWRGALILALCSTALALIFPMPRLDRSEAPAPRSFYHPEPTASVPPESVTGPAQRATVPVVPSPAAIALPKPGDALQFGENLAHAVPFAGHLLPLPPGVWRVVATVPVVRNDGVVIDLAALAKTTQGALAGLIILVGNDAALHPADGFPADSDCRRSDLDFTESRINVERGNQDCRIIDFLPGDRFMQPGDDPILHAAFGELNQEALRLPTAMIGPSFHLSDRKSLLIMEVLFNPELEGIAPSDQLPWNDNDWNKYNIGTFPDKKAYLTRLIAWSAAWAPAIRAAWLDRADVVSTPAPALNRLP